MPRFLYVALAALLFAITPAIPATQSPRIPFIIAAGSVSGVYYPLGKEIARIVESISPSSEAFVEITAGAVQNIHLIDRDVASLAFTTTDLAWDALKGQERFRGKGVALRAIAVFYLNRTHLVALESSGIKTIEDLRGRKVSTGAPTSGTENIATRLLEAAGLDPNRDLQRERLSVGESATAMKEGKIEAFFWMGGIPTPAITTLATERKVRFVGHGKLVEPLRQKYGPVYLRGSIPARAYPNVTNDSDNLDVWNLLVVPERANEEQVYQLTKALFANKALLMKVHREAGALDLQNQASGNSPIPFHPGALRYFKEAAHQAASRSVIIPSG